MEWFERDFDHPAYFAIHRDKDGEARTEGPALARLLALAPGRVLDLPCGWGRLGPALEAAGHHVVGGDLSALNLRRLREAFPGTPVRLDLRRLPFRTGCADGVLCAFTSWGYFSTRTANLVQLQEFARVLAHGGVLLLDLTGRQACLEAVARVAGRWRDVEGPCRERVSLSPDGSRVITERRWPGQAFRHDVWVPTDAEVRAALAAAGFGLDRAFGDLQGGPWRPGAIRWIYRAVRIG